jgi:hypothetical protein
MFISGVIIDVLPDLDDRRRGASAVAGRAGRTRDRPAARRCSPAVREAAARAIPGSFRAEVRSYVGIDLDALHAHGRLTCAESRVNVQRAVAEVRASCLRALAGCVGPTPAEHPAHAYT